jgi:hypothetical protein
VVDEDRPATEAEGIASDSRYFGPFGEPPPSFSSADASYEPVPTFESHTFAWPPPSGEPLQQRPTGSAPFGDDGDPAWAYGRPRSGSVIAGCCYGIAARLPVWRFFLLARSPPCPTANLGTNPARRNRGPVHHRNECQHC